MKRAAVIVASVSILIILAFITGCATQVMEQQAVRNQAPDEPFSPVVAPAPSHIVTPPNQTEKTPQDEVDDKLAKLYEAQK